jgi:hypothetical protein
MPNLTTTGFLDSTSLPASFACRGGDQALLLLRVILGAVLHEELEELGGEVLVEGVVELLDGGGNLEALLENAPGSLDANVLGPLDVAVQRRLGLERLADAKHLGLLLEEGVGVLLLSLGGLHARGGGGDLLSGGLSREGRKGGMGKNDVMMTLGEENPRSGKSGMPGRSAGAAVAWRDG